MKDLLSEPIRKKMIFVIGLLFAIYTLYSVTATLEAVGLRNIHLSFALILAFLLKPLKTKHPKLNPVVADMIDLLLIVLVIVQGAYMFTQAPDLAYRQGIVNFGDYLGFIFLMIVLLEAGRRYLGIIIPIIVTIFLLYTWAGPYMPGFLRHGGMSFKRLTGFMYTDGISGIFGDILGISATIIALFVIFGAVLVSSGVGKFFIDISYALFGQSRGGPAKISVFVSALMGMVNGSAASNVVTTGSFTIPTMIKIGYKKNFAGAVEAVASSGGQIMPPIMGIGAFLMADLLGIAYSEVVIAAIIPAIIYFVVVLFGVDVEARRLGLKGIPRNELPKIKEVLKKDFLYIVPILALVYFLLFTNISISYAGFWAIIIAIIISWFKPGNRMGVKLISEAFVEGSKNVTMIAILCALAGIIIGSFGLTGLALKLTGGLVELSGGSLLILLILTMIVSIILGMGMPTGTAYILVAILVAPALITMDVPPLAAHFFVFYFAVMSAITPPVAIASISAAAIAKGNPNTTGFIAMKLAIAAFIVPYFFVMDPALLLLEGTVTDQIFAFLTAIVGGFFLAVGAGGYYFTKFMWPLRVLMIIFALLLISPGIISDIIGSVVCLTIFIVNLLKSQKDTKEDVGLVSQSKGN